MKTRFQSIGFHYGNGFCKRCSSLTHEVVTRFYHFVFVMKMICDLECLSIVDVWRQHIFSLDLPQPQTTRRSPRTVSNFFAWYYTKPRLRLHELVSNTFYKIHFHNENQLIETESSSQGDSWLYSRHFSSGLIPYINHFHYGNNVIQF